VPRGAGSDRRATVPSSLSVIRSLPQTIVRMFAFSQEGCGLAVQPGPESHRCGPGLSGQARGMRRKLFSTGRLL
jgi:hypothetical protein